MANTGSIQSKTFTGFGNLVKLLPTGTVFMFQFLNPVLTNNGQCNTINKYLTSFLIGVCGLSCCFASFTDSHTGSNGLHHHGIVTPKGLWPSPNSHSVNSSDYKLRFVDFVHAFFSLIVFAILALLDSNTVNCFYPSFASTEKTLMMALQPIIGAISGAVFVLFPSNRHGIGYLLSK